MSLRNNMKCQFEPDLSTNATANRDFIPVGELYLPRNLISGLSNQSCEQLLRVIDSRRSKVGSEVVDYLLDLVVKQLQFLKEALKKKNLGDQSDKLNWPKEVNPNTGKTEYFGLFRNYKISFKVRITEAELIKGLSSEKLYRLRFSKDEARLCSVKSDNKPRKDMYFGFISVFNGDYIVMLSMENPEEALFLQGSSEVPKEGCITVRLLTTCASNGDAPAPTAPTASRTKCCCQHCGPSKAADVCSCQEEPIPLGEMNVRLGLEVRGSKELVLGSAKGEFRTSKELDESVNIRLNLLVRPEKKCAEK